VGAGGVEPPAPSVSGTRGTFRLPAETRILAAQRANSLIVDSSIRLSTPERLGYWLGVRGPPPATGSALIVDAPAGDGSTSGAGTEGEASMQAQSTHRPSAPGTAANVHLLIGNGRAPVVVAEIRPVLDRDVLYLRLQVDDIPRSGTRHTVDLSISGPPEEVAALVAELARVVQQVSR